MNIKKADLKHGVILIEKKPSKHTEKLHKIQIKGIYPYYDFMSSKYSTRYVCMTLRDSHYPAANSTEQKPLWLDGVMGNYTLDKLKKEYRLFYSINQ